MRLGDITPIMGNDREKRMEHDMDTGVIQWLIGIRVSCAYRKDDTILGIYILGSTNFCCSG